MVPVSKSHTGKRDFSLLQNVQTGNGHLFNRYLDYFPGLKWPGYKVNDSPPSSAKVKNELHLPLLLLHTLWCGLGKLYLYLSFVLTIIQAVLLTPELAFHYPTLDANDLLQFFDD